MLSVDFNVLGPVSELVQLGENLRGLILELGLQNFERLLTVELLLGDDPWLHPEHIVNLGEKRLRRARAVPEVRLDTLLRKVTQTQNVVFLQLLCYHPGQD